MSILKKPITNEKAVSLHEKGIYSFVVEKSANKIEIKKAVEQMYGVNVDKVRTMIAIGKTKNRMTNGRFIAGRKASYKKAIVTLSQGEIIDFYSGI
ncbi:large subunit ribosomal protein L23 [Flexibacter flexilis DSM 6793]|uniref:Large ribosomal subunit protein uL23 n=1 Tax=Flexibacter flexilis DSM 6793 TaxID=927664 RepID=A0A1I1N2L4_9BACT|nr:50S ribosomal protein L23 [Flexibacter flexilis]SFC88040.1 large subunit ribosomal protein L23 [Flexibacter flexilis DSM 6793]